MAEPSAAGALSGLLPPQADGSSRVRLYSRSNDEVSVRFPEIVELLPACLPGTTSAVIDAEVCAYDVEMDAILPFQSLAARPRKAPTAEQAAATPLCVFAFDLLVHDGVGLLQTPLSERRRLLALRGDAFLMLPGGLGTYEEFFEVLTGRIIYRSGFHPEGRTGDEVSGDRNSIAPRPVTDPRANYEGAAGRDSLGRGAEEASHEVRFEELEDIEDGHVPRMFGQALAGVVVKEGDVRDLMLVRDHARLLDLAVVVVEAHDG